MIKIESRATFRKNLSSHQEMTGKFRKSPQKRFKDMERQIVQKKSIYYILMSAKKISNES